MTNFQLITSANHLAIASHGDQKRKYDGAPYMTHCARVAHTVSMIDQATAEMVAAALLHDTLEDTQTQIVEIENATNDIVVAAVLGLTDKFTKLAHPHLNRAQRKQLERERYGGLPTLRWEIQTIKLADCLDNLMDIETHDPQFAITYKEEIRLLMPHLNNGDKDLWKLLWKVLNCSTVTNTDAVS